jgi:hypothetical protein
MYVAMGKFVVEEVEGGVRIVYASASDPGGMIPEFVVKAAAGGQAEWPAKVYADYKKQKG